jgi:preprotein translocase subunit SecB
MDKSKPSGISISDISMLACRIGEVSRDADLDYNLAITDLKRELSADEKSLHVTVSFDLEHGVENPPCVFLTTWRAIYSRSEDANMTWDEFNDSFCISHIIPYLREFVGGMTLRLPMKSFLLIPPTNVNLLLEQYLKSRT